jgi:hypothetical protein
VTRSYTFAGPNTDAAGTPGQCWSGIPAGELTYAQLSSQGVYTITSANFEAFSVGGVQVNGYIFKNTATSTTSKPSSTSNPTGNSPSPTQSQPANKGDSGLSSGAKAGIGIGVALVALAAVIIGVLLIRRKRRGAVTSTAPAVAEQGEAYCDAEPAVNGLQEKKGPGRPAEPAELNTTERAQELDGGSNYDNLERLHELA